MAARSSDREPRAGAAGEVQLDFERHRRIELDEAVFAHAKSARQLESIFTAASGAGKSLFVTRLAPEKFAALESSWRERLDYCPVSQTAVFGHMHAAAPSDGAAVAVVAAGTSDAPVAREAERSLRFNGVACDTVIDVGVAGLWRLMQRVDELRQCAVVIAVAGMDAALPTVLGGLIPGLIIAVPTSVGYGVAAGGYAALNAILASCSPGITVVNIDNGYGAACAALRALRMVRRAPLPQHQEK